MKMSWKRALKMVADPLGEGLIIISALLMFSMFLLLALHPFVLAGLLLQ